MRTPLRHIASMAFWLTRNIDRSSCGVSKSSSLSLEDLQSLQNGAASGGKLPSQQHQAMATPGSTRSSQASEGLKCSSF